MRFHAVYWPAFLEAAGQPPPTRIQVHPYLTVEGKKLSKSLGGGVAPATLADTYSADALRWWCARDVSEIADTDFTVGRLIDRANEDLANGLGNTVNRISTLVLRNLGGRLNAHLEPGNVAADLRVEVAAAVAEFRLCDAARLIIEGVAALNGHLAATEPWHLAKDASKRHDLERVLARQVGWARTLAAAAEPIVPDLSARLRSQLREHGGQLPTAGPAFERLEVADQERSVSIAWRHDS